MRFVRQKEQFSDGVGCNCGLIRFVEYAETQVTKTGIQEASAGDLRLENTRRQSCIKTFMIHFLSVNYLSKGGFHRTDEKEV